MKVNGSCTETGILKLDGKMKGSNSTPMLVGVLLIILMAFIIYYQSTQESDSEEATGNNEDAESVIGTVTADHLKRFFIDESGSWFS